MPGSAEGTVAAEHLAPLKEVALSIDWPIVAGHPNRLPFEGILTLVDVPSDKAPSGARGHRVVLTRKAASDALPGILGMAVSFKAGWGGHDARQKCGIITAAHISGSRLNVSGYIFARDFPDVAERMSSQSDDPLGMSYELADAHVIDMRAPIWTLRKCTFTGAAILRCETAAYRNTSCTLHKAPGISGKHMPIAAKRS